MKKIALLLIEKDPAVVEQIKNLLTGSAFASIDVTAVETFSAAKKIVIAGDCDIVLCDIDIPDCPGLSIVSGIHEKREDLPIIVMSGQEDMELLIRAVQSGAQDYLVKERLDEDRLVRSILYVLERHNLIRELGEVSIIDDLTGLYNRRGFMTLAQKHLGLASRFDNVMWLIYIEMDNLGWIDKNLGAEEADNALVDMSDILKKTFRESDVVARIGEAEFAVIAVNEVDANSQQMAARLRENINIFNSKMERPYKLSASIVLVSHTSVAGYDVNKLLYIANKQMYEEKSKRK